MMEFPVLVREFPVWMWGFPVLHEVQMQAIHYCKLVQEYHNRDDHTALLSSKSRASQRNYEESSGCNALASLKKTSFSCGSFRFWGIKTVSRVNCSMRFDKISTWQI